LVAEAWKRSELWSANLTESERILRAAVASEQKDVGLLTCLGAVLSDLGKHKEAVGILESALRLGSKDRNTFFNLGVAEINSGTHEKAMGYFKQAQVLPKSLITWEAYFDPQAH